MVASVLLIHRGHKIGVGLVSLTLRSFTIKDIKGSQQISIKVWKAFVIINCNLFVSLNYFPRPIGILAKPYRMVKRHGFTPVRESKRGILLAGFAKHLCCIWILKVVKQEKSFLKIFSCFRIF